MSVTPKEQLLQRIHDHSAVIAIIGLGYVGLPLGVAFAENGFSVVGIDVDAAKVEAINRGESYISDIPSARLLAVTGDARLRATTDYAELRDCDVAIICVPTPLNKTRDPDVRYLIAAGDSVARTIHPGMLVVLESTTYPGTTEDLLLPKLQQARPVEPWQVGEDFFVAFSPERIDPGRLDWTVERTPKVVGGMTPACLEAASLLYGQAIDRIVPVSSPAAAEMTKLLENTFRAVNIALVNEVAIMCDKLGLDVWEVIEAAATKPYGFMKFTPGPGVGGHCLDGSETIRYRWGDENGVLPVSELHRRALQRSRRIVPYHGAIFVAPTGLEVLSIDLEDGRQSWQPVSYLFERPYKGEVTRIETVDHRRLLVTDRHPMLVHEDGRLAVREAKDLAAGALLPVANATDDVDPAKRLEWEAARQRRTRTRRPQAQVPYALAQVKNVTLETGDTKVYGLEVAGAHTFAASTGIYVHNCIPLDPHYLSWKLKTLNYNARFIQLAGEINTEMPRYWVDKVQDALNDAGKPLKNSRVLVLGVAYKKDIDDVRESPALDIVELLRAKGADVRYHDPHVTSFSLDGLTWASEPDLGQALAEADCALIVTDHSSYDWPAIAQQSKLVVDTRNVV